MFSRRLLPLCYSTLHLAISFYTRLENPFLREARYNGVIIFKAFRTILGVLQQLLGKDNYDFLENSSFLWLSLIILKYVLITSKLKWAIPRYDIKRRRSLRVFVNLLRDIFSCLIFKPEFYSIEVALCGFEE